MFNSTCVAVTLCRTNIIIIKKCCQVIQAVAPLVIIFTILFLLSSNGFTKKEIKDWKVRQKIHQKQIIKMETKFKLRRIFKLLNKMTCLCLKTIILLMLTLTPIVQPFLLNNFIYKMIHEGNLNLFSIVLFHVKYVHPIF